MYQPFYCIAERLRGGRNAQAPGRGDPTNRSGNSPKRLRYPCIHSCGHTGLSFFLFFFCHRSTPSGRSSLTRRSATGTHNTWTSSKQLRWNVADNVYHGVRVITSFVNGYGQHAILCRSFYSTSCCLCYRVLISSQIFTFNRHRYRHAKLVGVPGGRHGRRQRIADTRDDGHETQVFVAGWRQTDDLLPAQVA